MGLKRCCSPDEDKELIELKREAPDDLVIALAGNPNTGKSTVFNSLTGLNQHTGNWTGKTVASAQGTYSYKDRNFVLVDLPGTYSLLANSVEEQVARDFICFAAPRATVVVADATCLERNLNMVLQVLEITDQVVVCVNLLDEAKRKKINVDLKKLEEILGVPVVGTNARDGIGLEALKEAIYRTVYKKERKPFIKITYNDATEKAVKKVEPVVKEITQGKINSRWVALRLIEQDKGMFASLNKHVGYDLEAKSEILDVLVDADQYLREHQMEPERIKDHLVTTIVKMAEDIRDRTVHFENAEYKQFDRKLDNILTSRVWGIPIMVALLAVVFWVTIKGANYPSQMLADGLFWIEDRLTEFFTWAGSPPWLHGLLVLGVFRTLAWVISVMLPPMAIFFPLFTLLEDLGYLPRVAFNMDSFFKKACAHGKQALTMCMGFGCNAAGVTSCRIIDSPRERLIATLTNTFVPCNGRFPTLIALASILVIGALGAENSILAAGSVLLVVILGVIITLSVSKLLSRTILKGVPSSFTLELPPYRKPRIGRIIVRSILDRTLFVLARAIVVAAPAGVVIWILANVYIGDTSILQSIAQFINPFANLLGLDGYILMAFILGFPANEIVIPILIMSYMAGGQMMELDSIEALRQLFVDNGWTWLTALCTMLFALNHWPCGTTVLTIYKETQSKKHAALAVLLPTATGMILCFIVAQSIRLLGLG